MSNTVTQQGGATPGERRPSFELAKATDETVHSMLRDNSTFEEIIVALSTDKKKLSKRIRELEGIAPRKVVMADGRVMVWHCPDELVP